MMRRGALGLLLAAAAWAPSPLPPDGPLSTPLAGLASVAWQPGDILFRRGTTQLSQLVLAAGDEGGFSHVGLVILRGAAVFVVHAAPAETPGEEDGTRIDPLGAFVQPARASRVAVYRLDARRIPDARARGREAAAAGEDMARRRVPFDFRFQMSTPEAVYCTELVLRAYAAAGVDLQIRAPESRLPFMREPIVFPDHLLRSPALERVTD